jgi:type II secretory pathway component PulF
MFSSRLPLSALLELCRSLKHYLGAGLTLVDAFEHQHKGGAGAMRETAGLIAADLRRGDSLEVALKKQAIRFPPLFLSLASVGERAGMLAEIFGELERYFIRQQKLRRDFVGRITWPVLQFVLAVFVLALLIFFLGQIASTMPNGKPFDPLGLGLLGGSGALIFLGVVFGTLGGLFATYAIASRVLANRAGVDRWLLGVPALGPCLRALALGRFCMALRLTTETGMSIGKAVRLSLRAAGNQAFLVVTDGVLSDIERGDDLTFALGRTGLFPEDLMHSLAVAEESGTLDAVLRHQGDHYHDEASRRLAVLTTLAGYAIWGCVGLFIIVAIFRLYSSYLGMLNQFSP